MKLNEKWVKEEIKYFLEFNESENNAYPNLRDTIKVMLKGNYIALSDYIKTGDISHNLLYSTAEISRAKRNKQEVHSPREVDYRK